MSARTTASLFGAALALTATTASAEDVESANYMLPSCRNYVVRRSPNDALTQGFCAGIVHGITFVGMFVKFDLKSSPVPDGGPCASED